MIILSIFLDIRTRIYFMKCSVVIVVLGFIRVLFRNKHDWSSLSLLSSSLWTCCCCCYSRQFSLFLFIANNVSFSNNKRSPNAFLTSSIANEKAYPANVKKLSFRNAVRRTTTMSYYSWDREKKAKEWTFHQIA